MNSVINTKSLEIENYAHKAVLLLESKFNLPDKGLLSGGAIANTIWKLSGGQNAVINDIDIFSFSHTDETLDAFHKRKYKEKSTNSAYTNDDNLVYGDYTNILFIDDGKYVSFKSEEKEGILNKIELESNTLDYSLILKSFDINSCQIGYDLENKKVIYTDEYLDFYINKKLKVVSIQSPPNTMCRLIKKNTEMGGDVLDIKEEFTLLKYSYSAIRNKNRVLLSKKLEPIYNENIETFNKYFKSILFKTYIALIPNEWEVNHKMFMVHYDVNHWYSKKNDKFSLFLNRKNRYVKKQDYLYFYRNIMKNFNRLKLWTILPNFNNNDSYLNGYDINNTEVSNSLIEDSKEIFDLIQTSGSGIITTNEHNTRFLEGMNLKEQIFIKNYIKSKIQEDNRNLILLNFIQEPLKYDNIKDLDLAFTSLRIMYRKKIQERINMTKDINNNLEEIPF